MWSRHVLLKYWAIQAAGWFVLFVAGWFAAEFFDWPKRVVWIVVGVWAAKDALLYPLVWRSFDQRGTPASAYPSAGAEGIVLRRLAPHGWVRVNGERWKAVVEGDACVDEGERVRVVARDGMRLTVVAVTLRPL
jgi:membrane-bound ClpP family serine protease